MELTLTGENFEQEVLRSQKPVLVDFWATWCGPCRMQAPVLEALAAELGEELTVGKVNVDDASDLASRYGVLSIPTLMLFQNGEVIRKTVGFTPREELLDWLRA